MISVDQLEFIGADLKRPECVLVDRTGVLHVADWRGGVTLIEPNGTLRSILAKGDFKPNPNGVAIHPDGGWLITHLGDDDGGVFRLRTDGTLTPFLLEVDGKPLPPTNYAHIDGAGRVWVTVSTRLSPRILGCKPDCDDGFIALYDGENARIVADGLGYTNECLIHPETGQLFVNETFGRRLTRFDVSDDGSLQNKTTVATFETGEFPDGLTFDVDGGVWITSIISNKVIRIDADGRRDVILDDSNAEHVAWVEDAYQRSAMERRHMDTAVGKRLKNISSLAFGGPDMKTAYLGCLQGDAVGVFRTEHAGLPPYHWHYETGTMP